MAPAHTPAPLGPRVLAWIVDHALVMIVAMVAGIVLSRADGGLSAASFVLLIVCLLVGIGWGVYLWWSGGERGATPGLRLMGLQVVSMADGNPVGWGRFLARLATVTVLAATVVGWPLMLIWLVADRNRRGWHDLAAGAIVTPQPRRSAVQFSGVPAPATSPVPLPAHLRTWAPEPGRDERVDAPPATERNIIPSPAGGYAPAEATGPAPEPTSGFGPTSGFEPTSGLPPHQHVPPAQQRPGGALDPQAGEAAWAPAHPGHAPMSADATTAPPTADTTSASPTMGSALPQATPIHQEHQPSAQSVPDDDPDRTNLRPQRPGQTVIGDHRAQRATPPPPTWQLVLDDGREVPLDRAAVLGRRPAQPPGKPVHLVTVEDTTKTLSKSHIRVDADADSPFVTDLGSTNGSALITSTGQVTLHAHQPRRIPEGQVVRFGEHEFTIRRSNPR